MDAESRFIGVSQIAPDTTERQTAEHLRRRLAAILQSSNDAVISVDLQGIILTWNPAAERMFGFTEAEAVGNSIVAIFPPEARNEQLQILNRLRRGEHTDRYETILATKAGKRIEVSLTWFPLRGVKGRNVEISGIVRDVTEQKRSAEALLRRLEFETFLFDLSRRFIGLPEEEVDLSMQRGLEHVAKFLDMSRVTLLELSRDRSEMAVAYSWRASGVASPPSVIAISAQPWWLGQVLRGDVSLASDVDDLPEEAAAEKEYLRRRGVASAASIPLRVGGEIAGAISFVTVHRQVLWTEESVNQLRAIGDILWNALKRRQAMQALFAAQRAMRESEELLRLVANTAPVMIWMSDPDDRCTYVNQGWLGFTGRSIEAELASGWAEGIHPEDAERCQETYKRSLGRREAFRMEYRLRRHDGEYRWILDHGVPRFRVDGSFAGYIGSGIDVTERKIAADRLEEYERVVEGAEEMIAVVDRDYRYLIANRKFVLMRNMTKAQVVGRFAYEILDKRVFESVIKEKLDECFQGKVVRYEMKYTYPTLGERDILVSYFPIESGGGGVDRAACIVQDITDRKRTEEELANMSRRLIEVQEEERTRLARDLHDDLAQRMVGLAMQLHSVARGLPSGAKERIRLSQVCDQANALTQDIQAISHRLHSANLEHLGLAVAAAGFCYELNEQHHLKIDFRQDGIPRNLSKDIALCLFRVSQEALTNALKHSRSREFQVSLWSGGREIQLIVQDRGIGFDPEDTRRGLGLTSMRERLKLVSGQLSIDSKPGRGTTVDARVPLSSHMKSVDEVG